MQKRLYHISRDWQSLITSFVPRVPKSRASQEEDKTPRICTSTSIMGCLIAHPKLHWEAWGQQQDEATFDVYNNMSNVSVLVDHGNLYGYLLRGYIFNVSDEFVISSSKLKEMKWVPDVEKTDEHWITQTISATKNFYVLLEKMDFKHGNWFVSYRCFESDHIGKISDALTIHNLIEC